MPSSDRLSALDGTFLELEDADRSAHMHLGGILVFGPRPDGGVPTLEEVRSQVSRRLDAFPAFRRRLAGPGPGVVTWQRWVRDEHFDVARHVLPGTLAAPGGWEELFAWAGDWFSARLDRTMPLWQVALVTGLGDGHWALVTKTHHCMVDGVGAVDATQLLLDGDPPAEPAGPPAGHARGAAGSLTPAVTGLLAGARLATHPFDLARRAAAVGELLVRDELIGAPACSLNAPIGPRRRLRAVAADLDEVHAVAGALGGTVNDVVLAAACAGLRALLLAREEEPPAQGVRAMVPVDVRRGGEGAGNHVSSLFVDLPVGEPDAGLRYETIAVATRRIKRSDLPLAADTLLDLAGHTPPLLHHLVAPLVAGGRLFNLTITNVRGPQEPLSALGGPLKSVWPLVPIPADHTVGIAVMSYAGRLMFGIVADHDAVPDVDVLAVGIQTGLQDLRRLADRQAAAAR